MSWAESRDSIRASEKRREAEQQRDWNERQSQKARNHSKDNEARIKQLESQLAKQKAAPKPKPKAKPKGPQQIDPVKHSPEISNAQKVANDYMSGLGNKQSPWEQSQSDAASSASFGNFNPGGNSTPSDQPQSDPQQFADKFKLDLMNSGATKDSQAGNESSMSGADILKRDKQQGWS
jgi:hypothetical protein